MKHERQCNFAQWHAYDAGAGGGKRRTTQTATASACQQAVLADTRPHVPWKLSRTCSQSVTTEASLALPLPAAPPLRTLPRRVRRPPTAEPGSGGERAMVPSELAACTKRQREP